MLTRIQSLLLHGALVLLYSCSEKYVASSSELVADAVQNLTVQVLSHGQAIAEIAEKNAYEFLKLNITWLPPNTPRQPSSYSIFVTSVSTKDAPSIGECLEGTFFGTINGNEKLHALVPAKNSFIDLPDLHIQPNCSYKVQVIANPRSKHKANVAEILYTVPACVDVACSCINRKTMLPTPKVNVVQKGGEIIVHWSTSSNKPSNIEFYKISLGVPLLISKNGLPVYNLTRIGTVAAGKTTFLWNLKSSEKYFNCYKVAVTAVDYHGCSGPEGSSIINPLSFNDISVMDWHIWFLLAAIIICSIVFGVVAFRKNYRKGTVFMLCRRNSKVQIHRISKSKSLWAERILQEGNALYVVHESEVGGSEEEVTDELRVPFKSVELIRQLGTGQFGKVYLGRLSGANETLVAVKMSQQRDASVDSEIRQEFAKEIEIMRRAGNHPHLVQLIGYCIQPSKPIYILLEYMQGGDLLTYLHYTREQRYNDVVDQGENGLCAATHPTQSIERNSVCRKEEYRNIADSSEKTITRNAIDEENAKESWIGKMRGSQFLRFAVEIAMGMEHLEAKGITHRDLAARNILLSQDLTLKISDFGLSRNGVYVIKKIEGKTRHLPIRWMSPEALHNRAFSSKSDVWSFGVVLWEISTLGAFPYSHVQDDRLLRYIVGEKRRLEQPENVPSTIYKLMLSCWSSVPENRPNFIQLVSQLRTLIALLNNSAVSNPCYALACPDYTDYNK